jgi:methyl-accepting chemotaxis protein
MQIKHMTLKTRFQFMIAVSAAGLLAVAGFWVQGQHSALLSGKREKTSNLIDVPYSILDQQYQLEVRGIISRQEAQRRALDAIRGLRYEGNNYFWINDDHPTMIMHPIKPAMDGTDLSSVKDPSGKRLFVDFVEAASKTPGGAFVEYLWPKPGEDKPVRKLSFVKRFPPWGWIIGTGIYVGDVNAAWRESAWAAGTIALICLLPLIAVSVFTWRSTLSRLGDMLERFKDVAEGEGDLTRRIPIVRKDEIGELAEWFNLFLDKMHDMIKSVADAAQLLGSASDNVSNTIEHIAGNVRQTSSQAGVVSRTAEHVSQNLHTVATGAGEMQQSINEIAKNAGEAARIVTGAVQIAETTTATVAKLGESSAEIGKVIKVITSIAEQTNLLALNATIESARAGEFGKGFAVVANEVKELAKGTAKATEDISHKIEAIRTDTKAAVDAIASIREVINRVNDISSIMAAAVEEQTATTNEMSRNVSEAAAGSSEITSNIAGVAEVAEKTSRDAAGTQEAMQQLVQMATKLRQLVERFKTDKDESQNTQAMAAGR